MNLPTCSYPRGLISRVDRDVSLLRHRNFHTDARACVENLKLPLRVLGKENIPQYGPWVITLNHYHRAGFGAQWIALAIAGLVPVNMHWIMTREFTYPGKWYELLGVIGS